MYETRGAIYEGGNRLRVEAPDGFDVMHTIDFTLNAHHKVVKEEYSELGSIGASETFTVSFSISLIDGKPPSERVSFSGQWDLLHKVNKGIPQWQSLVLEPTPIWFPILTEASDTLKPLATAGWTGPRIPLISTLRTAQCSRMTLNALLIFVGFLAGRATSTRFRSRH